MPIKPNQGEFSHIRFERIPDLQPNRRTRSGFNPRRPPTPSDRVTHAQDVNVGFVEANEQVAATRMRVGIDPSRLFVLEFNSVNLDLREIGRKVRLSQPSKKEV